MPRCVDKGDKGQKNYRVMKQVQHVPHVIVGVVKKQDKNAIEVYSLTRIITLRVTP